MYRSKNRLSEFDYPPSSEMDKTTGVPKNTTKTAEVLCSPNNSLINFMSNYSVQFHAQKISKLRFFADGSGKADCKFSHRMGINDDYCSCQVFGYRDRQLSSGHIIQF